MDALIRRRAMMAGEPPEPPGPTPVFYDRLVFDGTAYIDTDIVLEGGESFRVFIGFEAQKKAQRYFLLPTENSGYTGLFLNSSTNSTARQISVYYGSSSAKATPALNFSTEYTTYWLTPKKFGWSSSAVSKFTGGTSVPSGPLVIGSDQAHSGQAFTGRMGWFRIYGSDAQNCSSSTAFDSYTPVYTLRPCTYEGEVGMWCVETSKFYGNTAESGELSVLNI